MKILGICGSPRRGNTEIALKELLKGASKEAKTKLILLRKQKIKFCDGCLVCDKTGKCHIRDDMKNITRSMLYADIIIFGTPTYFGMPTAIMKNLFDRTSPLFVTNSLKNKLVVLIVTGQAPPNDISIKNAISCMKKFCKDHKMKLLEEIKIGGVYETRDLAKNKKYCKKLQQLGKKITRKLKKLRKKK